jgi:LPS export ABC transporter protein LptC
MVCKKKVLLILGPFSQHNLFYRLGAVLITGGIIGCGNDIETINAYTNIKNEPAMSAKNIEVVFSDSGRVQAKLYSILLNKYGGPKPFLEFPKGFRVVIYDTSMRIESTITSDYGRKDETTRIMEARGNVVVRNELRNQQLNTEKLTWDENRHLIFSNVKVKITTPDKTIYGQGLESDESFSNYTIEKPSGQMMVKKDSL